MFMISSSYKIVITLHIVNKMCGKTLWKFETSLYFGASFERAILEIILHFGLSTKLLINDVKKRMLLFINFFWLYLLK